MEEFYTEITAQLTILDEHFAENKKCALRVLDAKECVMNDDPINTEDKFLINRLLDDLLRIHLILSENKEAFNKFRSMYNS